MSIQLKPGKWRTRDGRVTVVEFKTGNPDTNNPCIGYIAGEGGTRTWKDDGSYLDDGSECNIDLIAPYTEPRLRPWKPEEVPVGAWYLYETGFPAKFADQIWPAGIRFSREDHVIAYDWLAEKYRHSLDNGKTWLPCGVMEGGE